MNREQALNYIKQNHQGVLTTMKKDGRPQLSKIAYVLDEDGLIKISTTTDRYKVLNIRRDSRVSMMVISENWYEYIVVEGEGQVSEEGELAELRRVYQAIMGKPHPDWQDYDAAMLRDHRVIISIKIDKIYPLSA